MGAAGGCAAGWSRPPRGPKRQHMRRVNLTTTSFGAGTGSSMQDPIRDAFKFIQEKSRAASNKNFPRQATIDRLNAIIEKAREAINYIKKKEVVSVPQMAAAEKSNKRTTALEFKVIARKVTGKTKTGRHSNRTMYYCSGGDKCETTSHKRKRTFNGHSSRQKVEEHIKNQHSAGPTNPVKSLDWIVPV